MNSIRTRCLPVEAGGFSYPGRWLKMFKVFKNDPALCSLTHSLSSFVFSWRAHSTSPKKKAPLKHSRDATFTARNEMVSHVISSLEIGTQGVVVVCKCAKSWM